MDSNVKNAMVNKAKDLTDGLFNFPQIDSKLAVWFIFEGKEYEVTHFNVSFRQSVDHKGQPQDEVRGGRILLTISEAIPDNIYKWAITSCTLDGTVEFRSETSDNPLRIEFANAYCTSIERKMLHGEGLSTALVISPEEISINGFTLDNHWVR